MFNVEDLSYLNAYRKSVTANGSTESRDPVIFGKNGQESPQPFALMTLSDDQRFAIDRAKKYALEQSIQNALNKQVAQLQAQDMNTIKRNQALVLLSRIYVGSISFEVGEEEIRKAFSPFGPIKSVSLSWDNVLQKHKGFAFVEFEVPEAASLVLEQMNGYMISGRGIKVGRPSNAPQTNNLEAELRNDPVNKNRIYVAGVHTELSETDIQTVFEAFGKVSSCILDPETKFGQTIRHKGYGYITFESEQAAIDAVTSMNGFQLAGQLLRVGRALAPKLGNGSFASDCATAASQAASVAIAAASINASVIAMDTASSVSATKSPSGSTGFSSNSGMLPPPGVVIPTTIGLSTDSAAALSVEQPTIPTIHNLADISSTTASSMWDDDDDVNAIQATVIPFPPESRTSGLPQQQPNEPSPQSMQAPYSPTALSPILPKPEPDDELGSSSVLLLENMVDSSDVDPDLEEEVAEECSNYGQVLRCQVHVQNVDPPVVRIFVNFDSRAGATAAWRALNNRYFDGRLVAARLYPDEEFQMRHLDL